MGLTFTDTNPLDLANLLRIRRLDHVTVDPFLLELYAGELGVFDAIEGNTVTVVGTRGDFNGDGLLSGKDIDLLSAEARNPGPKLSFDLTGDETVNAEDRTHWVHNLRTTYFGDANLDGEFNSSDLVDIFTAGQYEDDIEMNSTWATGDWNGDGDFDTGDLVVAFQDGGFENGPKAATNAVPEPSGDSLAFLLGLAAALGRRSPSKTQRRIAACR